MIRAENLHKSFGENHVLRGVSIEIGKGETVALIGGSGCGKTVLLKLMAGLTQPDSGRVTVDGHDMSHVGGKKLEKLRHRLGFLFQGGALFQSSTVFDNVAFPLREKTKLTDREIEERVMAELRLVGLDGSEHKYPAEMSGGMAKRAALARCLVESPEIMLFDEPTVGLDPIVVESIHEVIHSVQQRLNLTAVIVSHEIPNIFTIVDRVAMLHEGEMRFDGTPEEILDFEDGPVSEFIRSSMPAEGYRVSRDKGVARGGSGEGATT